MKRNATSIFTNLKNCGGRFALSHVTPRVSCSSLFGLTQRNGIFSVVITPGDVPDAGAGDSDLDMMIANP